MNSRRKCLTFWNNFIFELCYRKRILYKYKFPAWLPFLQARLRKNLNVFIVKHRNISLVGSECRNGLNWGLACEANFGESPVFGQGLFGENAKVLIFKQKCVLILSKPAYNGSKLNANSYISFTFWLDDIAFQSILFLLKSWEVRLLLGQIGIFIAMDSVRRTGVRIFGKNSIPLKTLLNRIYCIWYSSRYMRHKKL